MYLSIVLSTMHLNWNLTLKRGKSHLIGTIHQTFVLCYDQTNPRSVIPRHRPITSAGFPASSLPREYDTSPATGPCKSFGYDRKMCNCFRNQKSSHRHGKLGCGGRVRLRWLAVVVVATDIPAAVRIRDRSTHVLDTGDWMHAVTLRTDDVHFWRENYETEEFWFSE